MVDWSDNAVRATVAVVILNLGLLTAHAIKDDRQPETTIRPTSEDVFAALRETAAPPMSEDPNCFDVEELGWLTDGHEAISTAILMQGDLKPCEGTGVNFRDVDNIEDLILAAGVDVAPPKTEYPLSLSCLRQRVNMLSVDNNSNPELQDRERVIRMGKLLCRTRAMSKKNKATLP